MAKEKQTAPMTETHEGYTVLARRYRPQTFSDLIGQEPVARALANALKGNRVAHAYLFTGVRGVGKTSTARILAKALNCEKGPTATPCGECDICRAIAEGNDIDVIEIDGASNNSVENIRELRSNVQYRPSRARYKIYIIDEVHMLAASAHKSAFNALLKTLEEPPPHVKFIFATTEVNKIPPTILSRCQRFDFVGIPVPRIVEHLRGIVSQEGVQADEEALELVARRAGGSMRDAQSLLDQLLAFGGERLTVDQVHALLGTAGDERIVALAEAVLAHEVKNALDLLDEAIVTGLQLGELLDQMIAYWRDLMVVHVAGVEGRDLSVPNRHRPTLLRQAQGLNLDAILAGLDILSVAKSQLKNSNHGRTLVEMALVRLGRLENLVALPYLVRLLQQRGGTAAAIPVTAVSPPEGIKKKFADSAAENGVDEPQPLTAENLPEIWAKTLRKLPGLLARSLGKAKLPAIIAPNNLVLRFSIDYNGAKELLEAALSELTGQPWSLRLEGTNDSASALDGLPSSGGVRGRNEIDEAPNASVSGVAGSRRNAREEAEKLPLIKRAIDVLGASLQRVDEGFGVLPNAGTNADEITVEDES